MHDRRKDFFDYHAPDWDNKEILEKQDRVQKIFNEFLPLIATPALDLGCGTGILIPILLDLLPNDPKLIEFDIAFRMLVQVVAKSVNNGLINPINGDVHFIPFTDQSISTAICFESLPHFRDLCSALKELNRVLRAGGGLIILHLMGHEKLNKFHYQAGGVIHQDYLPSIPELTRLLIQNHFDIVHAVEEENLYLVTARKR